MQPDGSAFRTVLQDSLMLNQHAPRRPIDSGIRAYLLCLLCVSIFAWSPWAMGDNPAWVYRFDTRPPDQIFSHGFVPYGINADLVAHVDGTSLAEHTSAFVATTDDPEVISAILLRHAELNPRESDPLWVYQIRPTENFFDVDASLATVAPNMAVYNRARILRARYGWQHEWAAFGPIHPIQILSARQYRITPQGRVEFVQERANPAYRSNAPQASRRPYQIRDNGDQNVYAVGSRATGALGLAFGCFRASSVAAESDSDSCPAVTWMSYQSAARIQRNVTNLLTGIGARYRFY